MAKPDDVEKADFAIEGAESVELAGRLRAEIEARHGRRDEAPFAILAHDESGALIGGVNGVTHWRWLYVRHLWVGEAQRGRGLARRLVAQAEQLGRTRECAGVYIDTFDSRVATFYERLGFARAGEIADFPPGGRRIFLSKRL